MLILCISNKTNRVVGFWFVLKCVCIYLLHLRIVLMIITQTKTMNNSTTPNCRPFNPHLVVVLTTMHADAQSKCFVFHRITNMFGNEKNVNKFRTGANIENVKDFQSRIKFPAKIVIFLQ